jgi:hypothetical protein
MTTQKHHPCGPSCLRRRELCPGSLFEERDLPEISNPASERGTRLHKMIADFIEEGFLGQIDNEEEREIVIDMYEFFESVIACDPNMKYSPEIRLSYGNDKGVLFFGTCDVLIINVQEKRGVIIDWKTGFKEVDSAEDNIQGLGYAVCAMQMYGLESVTVIFYNPVIHQKTEYTFERSESLFNHVQKVIGDSKNGKGKLKPGEEQCLYCKAALHGTCPAFRGIATELYEVAKKQPLEMISTMPDSTLVDVVEKGKLISKLADAAEKELKDRCEKQGEVCGYFLKEISGGREADDLKGLWGMLKPELDQEDFLSCCKVSIPSLEKLFIKATGCPVKEGKERFADLTADYVSEKPPKKVLAKVKGEK